MFQHTREEYEDYKLEYLRDRPVKNFSALSGWKIVTPSKIDENGLKYYWVVVSSSEWLGHWPRKLGDVPPAVILSRVFVYLKILICATDTIVQDFLTKYGIKIQLVYYTLYDTQV